MVENSFSHGRNNALPAGLRVLVVHADAIWVIILSKMLKQCYYEVTTCGLARDALNLLRERKDGYDIVISDVNMPDMDGFKLLEHVGLEMDLPVIMMSVDGEKSKLMKGIQHGASDYLLKPIRMEQLRNLWQYVLLTEKLDKVRDIEIVAGMESIQMTRNGEDLSTSAKKRRDPGDISFIEKARVVWSADLHRKFVQAVCQIGLDKIGPQKILDLMDVPWLTREHVATHLRKYRVYFNRLQKENYLRTSVGGIKHSDSAWKVSTGSFSTQNSINMQQSYAYASNNSNGFPGQPRFKYNFPPSNSSESVGSNKLRKDFWYDSLLLYNVETRGYESDEEEIVSLPVGPSTISSSTDLSDASMSSNSWNSQTGFSNSSTSSGSDVNNMAAFDSTFLFHSIKT
ncbi:two-component response regulator ARR11-like [Jatropha curcas]|uniref:two-component response regulator ARR11-like n=1 Tax=Jatropha curcas TaxID=180498 RepID=UPI001894FC26|nr:two-component response regulator ARR11-like [Jatropha curcas]